MDAAKALEQTVAGLGYELVEFERAGRGLVRVFIDKPGGITVDDCALVSNQLTRLFAVEHFDYERLEVSSPGLDRPLTRQTDFDRFAGERAKVKLRVPRSGQRNFVGVLRGMQESAVRLEVEGEVLLLELAEIEKANLSPEL